MARIALEGLLAAPRLSPSPVARRGLECITWADFQAQVSAWRLSFENHPGRCFALFFADSASFAAALFGLWHAGKVAYLPGDNLAATVQQLRGLVDGFAGELGSADVCQASSADVAAAPFLEWPLLDREAEQLVLFTSGSTAAPLAIPKRLGQLFGEVDALERAFGATLPTAAEVLATVSHQHIYGLLFRVLWPLAAGRVFHAQRYAFIEDMVGALAPGGAALLVASPAHLKRLPAVKLPGLQAVFSSGGPLSDAALSDCLRQFGRAPIEVFGSSETGGIAWRQRHPTASATWLPLPGVEWRVNEDLLEIRSPHAAATGWMITADSARAQGASFELLGRADRVLKIEEKRVSVAAIEAVLLASACLTELRVLSLPAGMGRRQQLAVVAVPNGAGWALFDALGKRGFAQHLRSQLLLSLEPPAVPRRWRFVAELPVNSQGKATQTALLALFDPLRPQARVLERGPAHAELSLEVEAGLPQFDGHFDGHPVLPGVAQVDWAIRLGRELFAGLPAKFQALEALKFQQVITPGTRLALRLDCRPEAGQLSFRFSSNRGVHASGRVVFGDLE